MDLNSILQNSAGWKTFIFKGPGVHTEKDYQIKIENPPKPFFVTSIIVGDEHKAGGSVRLNSGVAKDDVWAIVAQSDYPNISGPLYVAEKQILGVHLNSDKTTAVITIYVP
jgi:hypothetical protein